jgi:hypothetical protein
MDKPEEYLISIMPAADGRWQCVIYRLDRDDKTYLPGPALRFPFHILTDYDAFPTIGEALRQAAEYLEARH